MFLSFAIQAILNSVARFQATEQATVPKGTPNSDNLGPLQYLWTKHWLSREDESLHGTNLPSSQESEQQQNPALPSDHFKHIESNYIKYVSMAQKHCNDDIENFRNLPLDELEGWAALLEEYQHDTYKYLIPYFEQVPEVLETLEALIASRYTI